MAKTERTGKRKTRDSATRRVPDLGYYIVVTDAKETEENYLNGLKNSLPIDILMGQRYRVNILLLN